MKENPDLDIDLDGNFSTLNFLVSLQYQNSKLHSDKKIPFNKICQFNQKALEDLKKEIKEFDDKLEAPYKRYSITVADQSITCSKKFYDDKNIPEKTFRLDFIFSALMSDQVKEKCLIDQKKIKNFDYMVKDIPKDKKVSPFRIHHYSSKNPLSYIEHLSELDDKTNRAPVNISLCPSDIPNSNIDPAKTCQTTHAVLYAGAGLDEEGKCQMKFANSWKGESGKSFTLTPMDFYHAMKKRIKASTNENLSLTWISPTEKWEEDSYHEQAGNDYIFKGKVKLIDENDNKLINKISGNFDYNNFEFDSGVRFSGKAIINEETGGISFKEGHYIRPDGSFKKHLSKRKIQFENFELSDDHLYTGVAITSENGSYNFLHALVEAPDGSTKLINKDGSVIYTDYKINDDYKYTGSAKKTENGKIIFTTGTLTHLKTGEKRKIQNQN